MTKTHNPVFGARGAQRCPLSVLVAESTPEVAAWLTEIVNSVPGAAVCAQANSYSEILIACRKAQPHLIVIDLGSRDLEVAATLKQVTSRHPRPYVLAISDTHASLSVRDLEAMLIGQGAVIDRPAHMTKSALKQALWYKLGRLVIELPRTHVKAGSKQTPARLTLPGHVEAVGIAVSTGGPRLLYEYLPRVAPQLKVPIFIAQHLPDGYAGDLAASLNASCPLEVKVVRHGEAVQAATIYLGSAKADFEVVKRGCRLRFNSRSPDPSEPCHPSGNVLFESMAETYGKRCVGIVLTGIGYDGASGLSSMRKKGALTLAQEQAGCTVYGMPRAAIQCGAAMYAMSPAAIFESINSLVGRPHETS